MAVITIRWKESLLFLISLICCYILVVHLFKSQSIKKGLHQPSQVSDDHVEWPTYPNTNTSNSSSSPNNHSHHDHENDHRPIEGGMSLTKLLKLDKLSHGPKIKTDLSALKTELNKLLALLSKMNGNEEGELVKGENEILEILNEKPIIKQPPRNYVIATKICEKLNETDNQLTKSLVMVKSVLISQLLYYNVTDKVDIHFVIKWGSDEWFIREKLADFGFGMRFNQSTLGIHFHNISDIKLTNYYKKLSLNHKIIKENECDFIHLFLPNILQTVDSILYLSTDTIITGSVAEIWKEFPKMDKQQSIGVARQLTKVSKFPKTIVDDGVILMNLTRMRHLNWLDKLLQISHQDEDNLPSSSIMQLFNTLLFSSKNLWYSLSCQFNFRFDPIHCTPEIPGDLCQICDCTADLLGIQIIQQHRLEKETPFHAIFEAYQKVNLSDGLNSHQLISPVKNVYASLINRRNNLTKCFETLNKFMFRNFFS